MEVVGVKGPLLLLLLIPAWSGDPAGSCGRPAACWNGVGSSMPKKQELSVRQQVGAGLVLLTSAFLG
jgi:hypothetical protein